MSLREASQSVEVKGPGPLCGVARLQLKLKGDDLAWLNEQLTSLNNSEWISDVLISQGHTLRGPTIARHRNRKCACDPA